MKGMKDEGWQGHEGLDDLSVVRSLAFVLRSSKDAGKQATTNNIETETMTSLWRLARGARSFGGMA